MAVACAVTGALYRKPRAATKHFSSSGPPADASFSAMSFGEVIFSAPGSLMLMGEHAVLHGRRALCAAINRRVRVRLRPCAGRRVVIRSSLGKLEMMLSQITMRQPFTFVLAALRHYQQNLAHGLDITIESEFSHKIGFGSSAAVTVALLKSLDALFSLRLHTPTALLKEARAIIRGVQGVGSGADAAASICGGIVLYRAQPLVLKPLAAAPRITTVYSGCKTPTAEVIRVVERARNGNPALFGDLFDLMDDCVAQAVPQIQARRWRAFGKLMNFHHGLQTALGTNTPALEKICCRLRESPGIAGAKISGSGLGDCAVGLGWPRGGVTPDAMQRLRVERSGVREEQQ